MRKPCASKRRHIVNYSSPNIKTWSRLGSCGAFGMAALELPKINENIVVLTADLCFYSCLTRYKSEYPKKFFNVGIAEQNMIGIAAGMAKEGLFPYATTYATFASMRCADQVRVNMGYMGLNIKLIGLTAGFSVGILGPTHMSIEDIAVMRGIPNLTILSPADCTETVKAILASASTNSPTYIRLSGTLNNPIVYDHDYKFEIGKAIRLKEGHDVALIATGTMVYNALKAAHFLSEVGVDAAVFDFHTIKPLDLNGLDDACRSKCIVTIEEHSVIGGLGGAVSEALSGLGYHLPHLMLGIKDNYPHAADYEYLIEKSGLHPTQIAQAIESFVKERNR